MTTIFQYIKLYFLALADLTSEMAPYLLLGFLFAGIMYVWFPRRKVYKYLGKPNTASVINAALIGIPLPLCSCGVIPTGISFYNSGASKGSAVSFLISTPQTGVDSIMVTYSLLGLPMAIVKPLIALFTGFWGGFLTNLFNRKDKQEASGENSKQANNDNQDRSFRGMLRYAFVEFLEDIAKWLVIGLLIAAFIDVIVPEDFFTSYLGNEYLTMLLILVVAIPLYVCATGSVPIAAILMLKGLSPGAAIVFLMAGPATNAATMTVIGKVLGRKTLLIYLTAIVTGAMFFGILINELLPREWFTDAIGFVHSGEHGHEILPYWLKWGSGIVLMGLIINAMIRKYFIKTPGLDSLEINNDQIQTDMKNVRLIVKGMNCNHCKMTVEENVGLISGIESVSADILAGTVEVAGNDFDLENIRNKIESLGYKYEGLQE